MGLISRVSSRTYRSLEVESSLTVTVLEKTRKFNFKKKKESIFVCKNRLISLNSSSSYPSSSSFFKKLIMSRQKGSARHAHHHHEDVVQSFATRSFQYNQGSVPSKMSSSAQLTHIEELLSITVTN